MPWLDVIGWCGSALLIFSLLQTRVLRFRALNLVASVVLCFFNAAIGVWPMAVLNAAIAGINVFFLTRLLRERHDEAAFEVLEVDPYDEYLRHVLRVHEADILKYQTDFTWDGAAEGSVAFLVQRADESVGVVLVHDAGGGIAQVILDYVTPRFRDFSPGEFVWRRSNALRDRGFRTVITAERMVAPYYARLGFQPLANGAFELQL